jgi:hypothetical protein
LDVSLINGFLPISGISFDILDWGSLNGRFSSLDLPVLTTGLWNTRQLYSTGVLSVMAGVAGDYNHNGIVDGADYTTWSDILRQIGVNLAADSNGNGFDTAD